MEIVLNGEKKEVKENVSLPDLLKELDLTPDKVAVELNLDIVDKNNYDKTLLKEGDKLEIVHFVGGG
jgi:sulfur carrier protein